MSKIETYLDYKNKLDNSPMVIFYINSLNKTISYFNKKFLKISGYNAEDLINIDYGAIIMEEDKSIPLISPDGNKLEFRIVSKSGDVIWLTGIKESIDDDISLWLEDVSIKKPVDDLKTIINGLYLNKLQEISHSKTEFLLNTLSKNLINNLNALIKFPSLLMRQSYSEHKGDQIKIPSNWFGDDQLILIVSKYDDKVGPKEIFSYPLDIGGKHDQFEQERKQIFYSILSSIYMGNRSTNVLITYKDFYVQGYKFKIRDEAFLRGKHQTYGLIFIRKMGHPFIPIINFKQILNKFFELGVERILKDDKSIYNDFFSSIKNELQPLNEFQDDIDEIKKYYNNIIQNINSGKPLDQEVLNYIKKILESFNTLLETLYRMFLISIDEMGEKI